MRLIGLKITLAILLPILLLLLVRVRVVFLYKDDVRSYLSILFFQIPLHPKKKKVKISDYTYEKQKKRLLKQRKKRAEKEKAAAAKRKTAKPPLRAQIRYYGALIKRLYPRFLRHFRIDLTRLHVRVGTGDAASTAILTGVVSQAVAFLLEFLSLHTNLHPSHRADVAVIPDFLADRSTVDCKIVFSLRVYAIIGLGTHFFRHLLNNKAKNLRKPQKKEDTTCLKTSSTT
jgi:hypothetical protein